jgi:hypothetical protein
VTSLPARLRRMPTVVTRAAAAPLIVRCAIFLTALTALAVAVPTELVSGRQVLVLPLLALWPAVAPRGRGATVVALLTVIAWLGSTARYGEPVTLAPVVILSALLYAGHSLAALAAVLPYDVLVTAEALARWLSRTLLVVVFSSALSVLALMVAGVGGGRPFLAAALAGAALAVGLAALLAWLVRRR